METSSSTNDEQTPATQPLNNSSSRRKQSKPNRLEHLVMENGSTLALSSESGTSSSILPSLTPYHVAAEQQDVGIVDDECDRISLNCEDGSLSSHSTGEHDTIDEVNQRSQSHSTLSNDEVICNPNHALDCTWKSDKSVEHPFHSSHRARVFNSSKKSRATKRKHLNGNSESAPTSTRIFHPDAFCTICRKEFCNKYFLKTHLANKHGIFDQQSVLPSLSTSSKEISDPTADSTLQHPFTVISTLSNEQDEFPSSSSSDIVQDHPNHQLESLRLQMNGVIAGDDDDEEIEENRNRNNNNNHQHDGDNEDGDEQDGSSSHRLIHLPEQIASILSNENTNFNHLKTDDDQRVLNSHSPATHLDFQTTTNTSRQSSAKILEDFCDICQKHFCNKYYLRKHKLDVHGVQTDCNIKPYKRIDGTALPSKTSSPSTSTQHIAPAIQLSPSFANISFKPSSVQQSLGMLLNPIFSPLIHSSNSIDQKSLSPNKRRYTDSSNDSSDIIANHLVNNNGKSQVSTCTLCAKKFQSNEYLQLHLMNKHQIKTDIQQRTTKINPFSTTSNPSFNNNTYKKIKLEANETPTTPSSVETNVSQKSPTVMPGIVDTYFAAKMADRVSCDICHKQVCNKYFLKTHKLKVHGVGPDPLAPPASNSATIEDESDQQPSMDHSPPQLVVDEISTEPGVIPSPDALTASVNTFIGSNHDSNEQLSLITCDLCSKTFPSKFLLHIHMSNVHGIQQASSLTNGTSTVVNNKNQLMSTATKKPSTNGNSSVRLKQTPQVQLRVTCQVCKKELCNKYFLRAHMRNVHNISVDELRLIQPASSTSPNADKHTSKAMFSSSSNLLSPSSTIATDTQPNSRKHSLSNDNEINPVNGHHTDSDESENISSSNDTNNNKNPLLSMQPFLVESDDDLYKDLFVPCMVYLPCRHRVTKPLEVSLRLKPVDNPSSNNPD